MEPQSYNDDNEACAVEENIKTIMETKTTKSPINAKPFLPKMKQRGDSRAKSSAMKAKTSKAGHSKNTLREKKLLTKPRPPKQDVYGENASLDKSKIKFCNLYNRGEWRLFKHFQEIGLWSRVSKPEKSDYTHFTNEKNSDYEIALSTAV